MSKIFIGRISKRELLKKIRREFPGQTEKTHFVAKGKGSYDRQADRRRSEREHERINDSLAFLIQKTSRSAERDVSSA